MRAGAVLAVVFGTSIFRAAASDLYLIDAPSQVDGEGGDLEWMIRRMDKAGVCPRRHDAA